MGSEWIDTEHAARIVCASAESIRHTPGLDRVVRRRRLPGQRVYWHRGDLERLAAVRAGCRCSMAVAVRVVAWMDAWAA